MTENFPFHAAISEYIGKSKARRADRADRAALESALRSYTTGAERAEMDAILGRFPESATHRAWESVNSRAAA